MLMSSCPIIYMQLYLTGDFDSERLKHTLDDFRKFTGRQLADYYDAHCSLVFGEAFRRAAGEDR